MCHTTITAGLHVRTRDQRAKRGRRSAIPQRRIRGPTKSCLPGISNIRLVIKRHAGTIQCAADGKAVLLLLPEWPGTLAPGAA
jgi:hypothetical protein